MDFEQLGTVDMDDDESKAKNKAQKAPKKPGGTFASMGLSRPVLKAIDRKGYKLATPIQRKCIPAIMSGRDVVAMARTGSGKSAAFLLPIIDRLKIRQPKTEIRALVVSPTRELATQTFKFVRDFTKFTNLTSKLIIGGESIGRDFETITSCPDILIATPGRLAHVLVEMKHKLNGLEIVVFDEADRLFEPGFKEMEQVNEICQRLSETKQTLLFSATMPQKLADFAKAGLQNPLFVRLDVESSLSETLKTIHLHCNQSDKFAILLHLLKKFINKEQMTVVFMPTKHHIEYAKMLLDNSRIDCCYVYSSLDPEARKINVDRFTKRQCRVMLVTDIAARGIDIPILDIVINFNFPFRPKLYIHRVGRVARAGKFGCAISLVAHDETPYLHALYVFFGLPVSVAAKLESTATTPTEINNLPDKILGIVPQSILDDENEILKKWHDHNDDLKAMVKVCDNAMKPYLKTREPPAPFSVKVSKDIHREAIGVHPIFKLMATPEELASKQFEKDAEEANFLSRIKSYKPQATIFEVGHIKGNRRTEAFEVMQKKRDFHDKAARKRSANANSDDENASDQEMADASATTSSGPTINLKEGFEDSKFYLKYQPDDYAREKGLELDKNSFDKDLKRATFDLVADDEDKLRSQKHQMNQMIWDRKRKKYIRADQQENQAKTKKIRTESGALISATYQSGLYDKWKSQTKQDQQQQDSDEESNGDTSQQRNSNRRQGGKKSFEQIKSKFAPAKRARRELKNPDEILKQRNIKEKHEAILRLKTQRKAARNAERNGKGSDKPGFSKGGKKGGSRKGKHNAKSPAGKAGKHGTQKGPVKANKGYKPPRFNASGKKTRPRH